MKDDIKESVISSQFRSDDDNEDETTYNYDDEMFKETDFDDEVVAPGVDFIEDGKEWKWYNQIGDTVHIDFDNWAVWEAHEKDEGYPAYFIVDVDTGFIDWGPCDTKEEAADFLDSKQSDEEDIDFSVTDYEDDYYVDESVETLKEDSLDDIPWSREQAINRIISVYEDASDDYQDYIVSELVRLSGFPDESYIGGIDIDEPIWERISDKQLRWLDNTISLDDSNKRKSECKQTGKKDILQEDDEENTETCNAEYGDLDDQDEDEIEEVVEERNDHTRNESFIVAPTAAKQAQNIVDYLGEFMQSAQFNDDKYFDEYDREAMGNTFDALNDFVLSSNAELDEDIDLSEYEEVNGQGYWTLYRKFKPGMKKAEWAAKHQNTGEVRKISYKQATGEEPIEDSSTERLARDAGKKLLPSKLEDIEDKKEDNIDVEETNQKYTSAKTSINSSKLPAIFKMIDLEPGTINLDFGGGKFDNVADYLADKDVTNLVYDPYNRSSEHNKDVVNQVRANGGADSATISNVLNVIAEETARNIVLNNVYRLTKPDASVYITVYEGDSSGNSGETKSGYQLNRKTADYMEEIEKVFPNVVRKGKLIIAKK